MLPTKGYFQDIECPFYNTNCGRPYCHFRHKRKLNENAEENVQETSKNVVPTYKPTPKSELANIHNSRSHIPISYVPDLSFKRERTVRPPIRIEKPTYKPTPLSLLSSANKPESSLPEDHEHQETIKDIQENIASNIYDPLKSEINFEDLSNEFELIDDIINDSQEGTQSLISDNLIKLESDIEKEQNKLNILKSEIESNEKDEPTTQNDSLPRLTVDLNSDDRNQRNEKLSSTTKGKDADKSLSNKVKEEDVKKEKPAKKDREKTYRSSDSKDHKSEKECKNHKTNKDSKDSKNNQETKTSHKDKTKTSDKSQRKGRSSSKEKSSKETDLKKSDSSKQHKSSEREKHRKEEKKHCSKDTENSKDKHKSRDKSKTKDKERSRSPKEKKSKKHSKNKSESTYDSEDSSSDSNSEYPKSEKKSDSSRDKKQKSRHRSRSSSKKREKKSKSTQSRSKSRSVSKEKHSKHKSKHKSRDRSQSRTRHKDEDKKHSKSRQDKEKSSRNKEKSKERKDSSKSSSKEKTSRSSSKKSQDKSRKPSSDSKGDTSGSESHRESHQEDDDLMDTEAFIPSDVDLDLDDEDETMRECYKIFSEYKPEPIKQEPKMEETEKKNLFEDDDNIHGKKRTAHAGAEKLTSYPKLPPVAPPKTVALPGQVLANRYKIAKMAQASNEQENIMNEVKTMTQPVKRPAASLLEAARLHKMKRLEQQKAKEKEKPSANVVDDILNGVHKPSPSQVKVVPKKIAAVANVALFEKAKERISLVKQQRLQNIKTVAQTKKSGRVAHVPEYSLANIPDVIQADKSKLPVNVRTRFLTMIADECSKLYALKEDAYNRALNEEFACYEKCKVLATYRNSAMLAVNRLRKEIQERENKGLGPLLSGENSTTKKESDFEGTAFYNHVKKWILTEEELDIHGYPRESGERGKAIINNRIEVDYSLIDENQRKCSRCGKIYQVDDDGWPLYDEECMYHPLKKRTIRGEQIFLCCKSSDDTGCAMSDTHVFDGTQTHLLEGYQTTLPPESDDDPRSSQVYALDCEMCYTTKGLELTRVTIVDVDCKTVYESLVKPLNPIIDYNTRFSGITKDQMDRTSTSILQVQANILHLCNSETILVGHSLESDMKALKIVHGTIIDTAVLFPHKMGLPHKRALRALASEYLKKIIQNDVAGHDSAEDAVSCMDLIKWKLKEELKTKTK